MITRLGATREIRRRDPSPHGRCVWSAHRAQHGPRGTVKSCVCPRSEQRAGKPACINHTNKRPVTNHGGNFEAEARAARSRYPGHTAGGKSSWAGVTRQSHSWLSQLFLCPVTRPHILLSKPSGATLPPAPQPLPDVFPGNRINGV